MLGLPRVAELGHGLLLPVRDEHRVEAEARRAARLLGDLPCERPGRTQLAADRSQRDELADVAGAAIVLAGQRLEDPLHMPALGPARGLDTGRTAERVHLEPGVLAEEQRAGRTDLTPMQRLAARVLEERVPRLRRIVVGVEEIDGEAGQRRLELAPLVLVVRAENERRQRAASMPRTCSSPIRPIPSVASSSSSSSCARLNGSRSAVACTSTRRPSPVVTTFRSTSAVESSE